MMQEDVFNTLHHKDHEVQKAQKSFDRALREAVRLLMVRREGRLFLRWLGTGQSAQSILQLIMEYEEEKHG